MAEVIAGNSGSFALQQSANFERVFFFGTTSQTVIVNISKNGGAFGASANSPATEISAGWYKIALTIVDTNTLGQLAYDCTGGAGGPVDFSDIVQATIFPQLSLDSNGNAGVTSNIKKNTAHTGFMFVMTDSATHAPKTGLTVSGFVALDGGSFSATGNAPVELANGWYTINLLASDVNGNNVALRFTATGADDRNIFLMTQP